MRSQRAESAASDPPLLLQGGTLLTLDANATVLRGADLLIQEGRIASIGAPEPPEGTRVLDVSGCLILPGLIQGHLHLGQTFFRGLAEERRLLSWLRERIWPLEAAHDDESAYWCGLLGAAECLLGGTTTIQDIGIGPGARGLLRAVADSGLRAFAGQCLMDSGDALPAAMRQETDRVLAATEALGDEFDGMADGRLRYVLNPRFILTCSDPLWEGIRELSLRRGWPVHTHALEQRDETLAVRELKGGGTRSNTSPIRDCWRPTFASPTASGSPASTSTGCAVGASASSTAPARTSTSSSTRPPIAAASAAAAASSASTYDLSCSRSSICRR